MKTNRMTLPTGEEFPALVAYLSEAACERYIEVLCEWSGGGAVTGQMRTDATRAAQLQERKVGIRDGVLL